MDDLTSNTIKIIESTGFTGDNSCRDSPIAVKELIDLIIDTWDLNINFRSHIINTLDNPENDIKVLDSCDCCDRHKINRPNSLQPWIDTPFQNCGEANYPCKCKCRHMSRFICRAFRPN